MKIMPNISLTRSECEQIYKREHARGGEGVICLGTTPNTLYKFFDIKCRALPMPENKQRKIMTLYHQNIEHIVRPLSTISMNGEIIGYEMTYDQHDKSLEKLENLPRKEMIRILRESKEVLEYFARKDIVYGDVAESNILVNTKTGRVTFCDIDNMQVGKYPIDIKGFTLQKYYNRVGIIDAKVDAYMHNFLTIRKLHYADEDVYDTDVFRDLKRGIYPTKFKQAARPIFESLIVPETFTGEYAIQYIKR